MGWEDSNVTILAGGSGVWAGFAINDVMTLYHRDGIYYCYKNSTLLGTYTGRPYALGPSTRRVGLVVMRGSFTDSGMLDNFYARDLP